MQGLKTCRISLLLLACLWLVACGRSPALTPTPLVLEAPVEVPIGVTRLVAQEVSQQVTSPATPTPSMPCASIQPVDGAPVTIGAILPLSSPGAILAGFAMQVALNIAVSDINAQGGVHDIPIRLVTYDSAGIAERATQFAERLILLDCAVGIVGLYHNAEAMAVTEVAHRYGIPVIVTAASADDVTARHYLEVFRLSSSHSMLAEIPAAWLSEVGDYNGDGVIAATIIADNTTSSSTLIDAKRQKLLEAEIEAEVLRVDLPSTDFSSVIARLVAHEQLPDAIFINIKGDPALLLQAQLLDAGIGPQRSTLIVQSHAGLDSAQFWNEVPNGIGTIVLRQGAWPATLTEQGHTFAIQYDRYMARWPEPYAFASYDAIWLLAAALRDAPTWRGSDLIATLEQSQMPLTNGEITFSYVATSPEGELHAGYSWHQWLGTPILYLQYTEANQPADAMSIVWPPHLRSPGLESAIISTEP